MLEPAPKPLPTDKMSFFNSGYVAFKDGEPVAATPEKATAEQFAWWLEGWWAAHEQQREATDFKPGTYETGKRRR